MKSNKITTYVLWAHHIFDKNWNVNDFINICEFNTPDAFWKIFNNFGKLCCLPYRYCVIKKGFPPAWENQKYNKGCILSILVMKHDALKIWIKLNTLMVTGNLSTEDNIIALVYVPKQSNDFIKIWCTDSKEKLQSTLSDRFKKKYSNLQIKYLD